MRDREGKEVSISEFRQRWAEGIRNLSPVASARASLIGMYVMLAGIAWGIMASLLAEQYWLFTILAGSLLVTGITTIQAWQKYKTYLEIENLTKEVNENGQESTD